MGKIGKISVIKRQYEPGIVSYEASLANHGYNRTPGTFVMRFPFKEVSGIYRTGLDENAKFLRERFPDPETFKAEQKKIIALREHIKSLLPADIDLSPRSKFWNYAAIDLDTKQPAFRISPVRLIDGDNIFDLDDVMQLITYTWLKVHPSIAPSLEAYYAGEVSADTLYYVNEEDYENQIIYNKKKALNDAVKKFDSFSLDKRKQVGRIMGIPFTEDTPETVVYNQVDSFLRKSTVDIGPYRGHDPLKVFEKFSGMDSASLAVRDTVEQALSHNIYRVGKGAKIMEGNNIAFKDKDDMIEYFGEEKNQIELISLQEKLKFKKLAKA